MNGWFPRISKTGSIASGNNGIWVNNVQVSLVGIGPIWADATLVFNRNNNTTDVGGSIIPAAYNNYAGSYDGRWAGVVAAGNGRVDIYDKAQLSTQIPSATAPRFGKDIFGYLTPFQTGPDNRRTLYVNGQALAQDVITDWVIDPAGSFFVYQIATGTYTRQIKDSNGHTVSITTDEAPLAAFVGPDGQNWLLTGTTNSGSFVRPVNSFLGYRIAEDLYYPDARMVDNKLLIAGSTSQGVLVTPQIDFSAPRIDLRSSTPTPEPPKPMPTEPWKVNFISYDKLIQHSVPFKANVAIGNDIVFVFEKDSNDELHVTLLKGGVVQDRSGLARKVVVKG